MPFHCLESTKSISKVKLTLFILFIFSNCSVIFTQINNSINKSKPRLVIQKDIISAISAFSYDGKLFADAWDTYAVIYDVATGRQINHLTFQSSEGSDTNVQVDFSPDNSKVVVFNGEYFFFWDFKTGKFEKKLYKYADETGAYTNCVYSSNGNLLYITYDSKLVIYNIITGTIVSKKKPKFGDFDPKSDLKFLKGLIKPRNTKIELIPIESKNKPQNKDCLGYVDEEDLTTGYAFRDTLTNKIISNIEINFKGCHLEDGWLSFFNGNKFYTVLGNNFGERKIENINNFDDVINILPFQERIEILQEPRELPKPDKLTFLNLKTGQKIGIKNNLIKNNSIVSFSKDQRFIALSDDLNLRVLDTKSGKQIVKTEYDSAFGYGAIFSPNDRYILLSDIKKGPFLYELETRKIKNLSKSFIDTGYEFSSAAFSPDESKVILITTATSTCDCSAVKMIDVATGKLEGSFKGHKLNVNAVAFSPNGKTIATVSSDLTVRVWDIKTRKEIDRFQVEGYGNSLQFSEDSKILLCNSDNNTTYVWNIEKKTELFRLFRLKNDDWVVIAPDGRFDTNVLENIKGLHWILPDQPLTPKPLEIFMRQYYEPGLLRRVLQCNEDDSCDREFSPLPSIADINRVQPKVVIKNVKNSGSATDLVDVTIEVENMSEVIKVSRKNEAQTKQLSSGVYDLRLFRDSQLVDISTQKEKLAAFIEKAPQLIRETKSLKKLLNTPEDIVWRETTDVFKQDSKNIRILSPTRAEYTFRNIKLPKEGQKETEFTAYAFNSDKVKSEITAPFKFVIPNSIVSAPKKPQAFIISIGVNASQNRAYNLRYAADDAKLTLKTIKSRLEAERENYSNIVGISLLSDYDKDGNVTEKTAQKAVIKGVFSMLAGKSYGDVVAEVSKENPQARDLFENLPDIKNLVSIEPQDTLIIMFSGHGYSDNAGIFYLLPYDIEENTTLLTPAEQRKTISSDELSLWMQDITAKEMIFIIDACHSSKAVQGDNFKPGPMGSRGLGQLAYDKDMKILSATQDNEAWELVKLKQGLLTYSLIQDGIINSYADKDKNKELTSEEWLSYAETRVPELYQKEKGGGKGITIHNVASENTKNRFLQQPSLFKFKRRQNSRQILFKLP